jgi:hypothetical protein
LLDSENPPEDIHLSAPEKQATEPLAKFHLIAIKRQDTTSVVPLEQQH